MTPDADSYSEELYEELRRIAARKLMRERPNHTLDVTDLVNEAYLRLSKQRTPFENDKHFLAIASTIMHRVLIDYARKRRTEQLRTSFFDEIAAFGGPSEIDLLDISELIEQLAGRRPRMARIVNLRFFMGKTIDEISEILGVHSQTIKNDWSVARALLGNALSPG